MQAPTFPSPSPTGRPHDLALAGCRRAHRSDLRRLSWANAAAFYRRKPPLLRWLLPFFWLGKAPIFYGWLAAGEVWCAGVSSSVVLSEHRGDRSGRRPGMFLLLGGVLLLLLIDVVAALTLPLAIANAIQAAFFVLLVLIVVGLLVAALPMHRDRLERTTLDELTDAGTRTFLLHDLARSSADPAGTGTALLAAVIRDTSFSTAAAVATAVTTETADRYSDAGMQRVATSSRVVLCNNAVLALRDDVRATEKPTS